MNAPTPPSTMAANITRRDEHQGVPVADEHDHKQPWPPSSGNITCMIRRVRPYRLPVRRGEFNGVSAGSG